MDIKTCPLKTKETMPEDILIRKEELKDENLETLEKVKLLIAKISHEFKTPLNSIMGFTELIKNSTENDKIAEYSNIILNCSEYMLTLVQNLIDITKSKYKTLELSYSIFNPKELIKEVIDSYNNIKIKYTLINCTLVADYTRFKQLIINLISNAVKFSNNQEIIEIITYTENNNYCFEITDIGEGIAEEDIDKIFDFFSQVTDEQNKRNLGSGIGLSLCKSIVTAHNGVIYVKSQKGKGSTFTFKIPREPQIIKKTPEG